MSNESKLIPAPDTLKQELATIAAQMQQIQVLAQSQAQNAIYRAWIELGVSKDAKWDEKQMGWTVK